MANFSEYFKNDKHNAVEGKISNDELESMINKYSELSEDRLISEFIRLTIEKKKRGELNPSDLETLKNTLAPMLNSKQKDSLDKIIELVKNVR